MTDSPDILIVGAGPAGAVAAVALATAGRHVLLIEQRRFPREKVCGECLSALGIDALRELDLADDVQRLGSVRLHRAVAHAPDGTSCQLNLPRPMWGISRQALDHALLHAARRHGAQILSPARCVTIEPGERPSALILDLSTGQTNRQKFNWILIADGKGSLLPHRSPATGDLGIKACLENVDAQADAIHLFGVTGHYGGLAPIEAGRWNCAFSVPAARVAQHRGDLEGMMRRIIAENAALSYQLRNSRPAGSWRASPLPRFPVARSWPRGILPLGNAAAAIEPIGGEGMGLAMQSALLASRFIEEGGKDTDALRRQFARLWWRRRLACRAAAIAFSRPAAARLLVALGAASAALSTAALGAIGKFDAQARFASAKR